MNRIRGIITKIREKYFGYRIYIGGSLARTFIGLDNSFKPSSDIDLYIFNEKPIYVDGYVYGHRVACQYIPTKYHDTLVTDTPYNDSYPVIDLNYKTHYIRDIGTVFIKVRDDVHRGG